MASTQTESRKKSSGTRTNSIGGFIIGEIDGKVLRAYVKEHPETKVDLDGTDEQVALALVLWFKENTAKEDWVKCDICSAVSSAELDSCPFCGDGGEVEASDDDDDEEEASASDRSDKSEKALDTAAEDEEDGDADVIEHEEDVEEEHGEPEHEARAAAAEAGEAEQGEEDEDEQGEVTAAPPAPKKNAAAKKKESKMATTEVVNGTSSKKSTALATPKGGAIVARELDKAVKEVRTLISEYNDSTLDAAETYWNMGKKLAEINAGALWKLRTGDDGKGLYKSFDTFVVKELGMSAQQAYAAIDVAKEYDSPKVLREIGPTKAANILKAAPVDRPALVEAAKGGATVREINQKVQESRKKHGSPKAHKPQAKAGAKGAAKTNAAASTRTEKVSVALFEGTKTVKLYAKPESLRNVDFSKLKRAKALGDVPFGRVEMANGLVQTIAIIKDQKTGELIAKIDTRREG